MAQITEERQDGWGTFADPIDAYNIISENMENTKQKSEEKYEQRRKIEREKQENNIDKDEQNEEKEY